MTGVGPPANGAAGAPAERDPFDARLALQASGALREFNRAGVLSAADVHVARRLGTLAGEDDEGVLLAVALAVRAPRLGHVLVDLAREDPRDGRRRHRGPGRPRVAALARAGGVGGGGGRVAARRARGRGR